MQNDLGQSKSSQRQKVFRPSGWTLFLLGLLAVVVLIEVKAPAEQSGELMSPGASILLAFPAETLVDLVTFADYIAVIEITGETEIIHPDDLARGEGLVLRDVHAEAVQVLWSFSDEKKLDATFSLRTFGSIMRDGGQRSSMAGPGTPTGNAPARST